MRVFVARHKFHIKDATSIIVTATHRVSLLIAPKTLNQFGGEELGFPKNCGQLTRKTAVRVG